VIAFHDCGENFERVRCPHCGSEISIGLWQDWMSEDWSESAGFRLIPKAAPCCQTSLTLNDLTYTWPQGFARFSLTVVNPGTEPSADTITRLQEVLGCELRVIRRTV
jgi:hypothetical protein